MAKSVGPEMIMMNSTQFLACLLALVLCGSVRGENFEPFGVLSTEGPSAETDWSASTTNLEFGLVYRFAVITSTHSNLETKVIGELRVARVQFKCEFVSRSADGSYAMELPAPFQILFEVKNIGKKNVRLYAEEGELQLLWCKLISDEKWVGDGPMIGSPIMSTEPLYVLPPGEGQRAVLFSYGLVTEPGVKDITMVFYVVPDDSAPREEKNRKELRTKPEKFTFTRKKVAEQPIEATNKVSPSR